VSFKYRKRGRRLQSCWYRAFHASMLLKKKVEKSLFVALIGFCKYGISDLDHDEGVYTEKTSRGQRK
jgi:hypothetical protein